MGCLLQIIIAIFLWPLRQRFSSIGKFFGPERSGRFRRSRWFYNFEVSVEVLFTGSLIFVTRRRIAWKFTCKGYGFINLRFLFRFYTENSHNLFVVLHVAIEILLGHRVLQFFIFSLSHVYKRSGVLRPVELFLNNILISSHKALTILLPILLFDYKVLVVFKLHFGFAVFKFGDLLVVNLQNLNVWLLPRNICDAAQFLRISQWIA